jgi:hypothetical protein
VPKGCSEHTNGDAGVTHTIGVTSVSKFTSNQTSPQGCSEGIIKIGCAKGIIKIGLSRSASERGYSLALI